MDMLIIKFLLFCYACFTEKLYPFYNFVYDQEKWCEVLFNKNNNDSGNTSERTVGTTAMVTF